jgi:hypothetical protein
MATLSSWYGSRPLLRPLAVGITKGCEVKPDLGEEAVQEAGAVLHPFEPGLGQGGELADVAFGQVRQGRLCFSGVR